VQNAVSIDVERDLTCACRGVPRDPGELELADGPVVESHLALALENVDLDCGLVVLGGAEGLRLLRRIVVLRWMSTCA